VDAAFFDKTGTLTKNGLDFIYYDNGHVGDEIELSTTNANMIRLGMAVCHTITVTQTGDMLGNQVDLVAFKASEAIFDEKADSKPRIFFLGEWYTVLKRFEFDTHRATQSVIVEKEDGKRLVFVKGSPEAIRAISQQFTVPRTYHETLRKSALSGIYQIAIGFTDFNVEGSDINEISRDDIEKLLTFGGFIDYQNEMKNDAPEVLQELKEGGVLLGMITGDSVLTGICIARESGLIEENRKVILGSKVSEDTLEWTDVDSEEVVDKPHETLLAASTNNVDLALSGEAWIQLLRDDREYATSIAKYVRVFGRCTPTDKVAVVSTFVENGYVTLMCGDGQNDCGALKSAHVGVALSTSEASVVAPFTSLDKAISSVPEVLREGRCALASAFAAYKYYIIYGQVESYLQTINAYFAITFSDWCWVFLDGLWSITMAFSLPLSKAASRLSPVRPTASLLGAHTLFSACGILAWNFLFLVIALLTLFSQDWFQCRKWNSDDVSNILRIGDNYESSVLFVVGGYQYIASAIALNFGYTFRASWWRNYLFVLLATLWTVVIFVMTTYPSSFSCIWRINCDNEVRSLRGPDE
jgi:magnesium-transporting ATPase (P-type)